MTFTEENGDLFAEEILAEYARLLCRGSGVGWTGSIGRMYVKSFKRSMRIRRRSILVRDL